jgi:putative copper export protein
MDALFWINVLTRWLHVTSAVIGVGALFFLGLVVRPAMAAQEPSAGQAMVAGLLPRVKTLIHSALGLLLLTGFYNYYVAIPKVRALAYRSLYHPIMGTKILLALVLMGIVSAALASASASANMQGGRSRWLPLNIALALVILFLSAILRRMWP